MAGRWRGDGGARSTSRLARARRTALQALSVPRSIYKWKAKFGGLEVSDARRLKQLEDENARLKRLLADAMLDAAALKDLLSKKW